MSLLFDVPTLAEAARLVSARKVSPVELTDDCLKRIAEADGQLASFVTVVPEIARARARAAEVCIMRGEAAPGMLGIPYALKDIFETAGVRTTGHSKVLADHIPAEDCTVEQKLGAAGGVLLGKTATWEFAHGGPSWDILFPPARNPWNPLYEPSGSSSGSAAAVAAGFCFGAMGSDTGGSIRGPAAVCGIVGLKPSFGLVSRKGVLPNSMSCDHCGPLTRAVEDAAIMLDAIAGYDPCDSFSCQYAAPGYHAALVRSSGARLDGLKIGVPWHWIEEEFPASAELRAAFDTALAMLRDAGAQIRPVQLPPSRAYEDAKKIIAMCELFAFYAPALRKAPELFGESFRYRVMPGGLVTAEEYIAAQKAASVLKRKTDEIFAEVDLLATPAQEAAGMLAPDPPEELFSGGGYQTAFSLTGVPAIVVPMGQGTDAMPVGLQLVAARFDEERLLHVAHVYEQGTQWFERLKKSASAPGGETPAAVGDIV